MPQPPDPPVPSSPPPPGHPFAGAPPAPVPGPGPASWGVPPPPSWAPAWTPPPGPTAPGGPVAGPPRAPAPRPAGTLPLAAAAAAGLLIGVLGSGLVVAGLVTASVRDLGDTVADRLGAAVEQGIVDGTRQATEDAMADAMGGYPGDTGFPSGPVPAGEQFPPVPPEGLGLDPVLDGHARECFDGALRACDDLLYESTPLSDYEDYAATCAGRVPAYTVVTCTELE